MGRKEDRLTAHLEKDPIRACREVRERYLPDLMGWLSRTEDPRDQRYITYTNTVMLCQMLYKGITGIVGMREMTRSFNNETVSRKIHSFAGSPGREYLPHHVTENEYLSRLDPSELEGVIHKICCRLIRRKTFDAAKSQGRWAVIIDGTRGYSGKRRINSGCLERHSDKGTETEAVSYHCDILEAKLYLGEGLVASICSEPMDNSGTGPGGYASGEARKQDCETKAFKRLAEKLKKGFPRLPMVLLMDSLYASGPVMDICARNGWDYIIRFKDGSIPSIAEEYRDIPEKETAGDAEYVNDIDYNGRTVHMLKYHETRKKGKEKVRTDFQWLTSIRITGKNAEKIAGIGRCRWKIENQGFNRQKHWCGDITHACSWDSRALRDHYLLQQISDLIRQLYEWHCLRKNGIDKTFKKISSDLLYALAGPTWGREDTIGKAEAAAFC